jgi:hypothetical protein
MLAQILKSELLIDLCDQQQQIVVGGRGVFAEDGVFGDSGVFNDKGVFDDKGVFGKNGVFGK